MKTTRQLGRAEIDAMCSDYPPIVSPAQLAKILGISVSTLYQWLAAGRLDGAHRKRGKRVLISLRRAVELVFNGPEWRTDDDT